MCGSKQVISKLTSTRAINYGEHNFLVQAIAEELLTEGSLYYQFLQEFPKKLQQHKQLLWQILDKHFGDIAAINMNSPTHIFLKLNDKIGIVCMYENRGELIFSAGYLFNEKYKQLIILCCISLPPDQFESAIIQLRKLADSYTL